MAAALDAVRAAVPRVPVGIATGAWAVPDPAERLVLEDGTPAADNAALVRAARTILA